VHNNKNNKEHSMRLYGFTGKAGSGKDTSAQWLVDNEGYSTYALARRLKAMLHVGLGLDPADYVTPAQKNAVIPWLGCSYRHCAQTLGTEWGRKLIKQDLWTTLARPDIEGLINVHGGVAITDVRFEDEAAFIREMGGVISHIVRQQESALSSAAQAHDSEKGIAVHQEDEVIVNAGSVDDLHRRIAGLHQRRGAQ
jgi:hypothetical protein